MEGKVDNCLKTFVDHAIALGYLKEMDRLYSINRLLDVLQLSTFDEAAEGGQKGQTPRLKDLAEYLVQDAVERGIIEDRVTERDRLMGVLMDQVMPRPSQVNEQFWQAYQEEPQEATDWFYRMSQDVDYIKTDRIAKNLTYKHQSPYGVIDLTINLSKPEKDPRKIAALRLEKSADYPKCALCIENEGLAGDDHHAPRANHRVVRLRLLGEDWGFQYSPYSYFNEHCIFLSQVHRPMQVNGRTLAKLLGIIDQLPHYFVGSNAGLPIVGGSILSHDHYQGGRYHFAMESAQVVRSYDWADFPDLSVEQLYWPLSVIRLRATDQEQVLAAGQVVLEAWAAYSDPSQQIFAQTDGVAHNAISQ